MTLGEERRSSFDRNAALYDAVRPSYHPGAIEAIAARAAGKRVLEIGAGTGKATELLARAGFEVTAVEPGARLVEVLEAKQLPGVTVVPSRFEAVEGTGFDAVVAAQSWHWMDPETRFARAAAAAPLLAILHNHSNWPDPDLRAELDAVYARYFPTAPEPDPLSARRAEYAQMIAASGLYHPAELVEYAWSVRYTTEAWLRLLSTYSDHAVLAPDARAALFGEIAAAWERQGGSVEMPYVTLVVLARRLT